MLAKNFKKSLLAVNIGLAMGAGFSGVAVAADSEVQAKEDVEAPQMEIEPGRAGASSHRPTDLTEGII